MGVLKLAALEWHYHQPSYIGIGRRFAVNLRAKRMI
jgi:hypothetical protein